MEANGHQNSVTQQLGKPVQFIKGVGPRLAPRLEKLNLKTARDLLFFFPRDYQDVAAVCPIEQLQGGQAATVCGTIEEVILQEIGSGRSVLGVLARGETEFLRAVWFNQPFMRHQFAHGQRVMFSGIPQRRGLCWQMNHPRVEVLGDEQSPSQGRILPIYRLTDGLSQSRLRRIVQRVVDEFAAQLDEVFPEWFLAEHDLWPIQRAVAGIHAPSDRPGLECARRRFVYQELLSLQLALAMRRSNLQRRRAPTLTATAKIDARIRRLFPFALTDDQQLAIREISGDMDRQIPMNRLLQGEVGSGKTVVAEYALLLAVAHGYQAALMAPTEVLARQHVRTLESDLRQSRVRIGLLTGSLPRSARRELQQALNDGQIDILVGTQSLLHDQIEFPRLGLVVIDEQHKFGVRQRAALKQAAVAPHYLVMTATPIPRTLTMVQFGDLDISTIRQSPPGRQPVHTYLGDEAQRAEWWDFVRAKLRDGRQGYVITPRVENDQEEEEVASAEQMYEQLSNGPLEPFRLDLLHGRMPPARKEAAMESFRLGRTQVLVATSVVEVGVNVPNATIMTIEGGERFGLAQLHQLRGRIRRGKLPSYLCLFSQPANPAATDRLKAFADTTDGFKLAEIDFAQRGPGDLFGTRQHGMPPLRVADLHRDADTLEETQRDARQLIEGTENRFSQPEFARLKQMVLRRYGDSLDLVDVG